jgi:broad specificity phosphatase PhoE
MPGGGESYSDVVGRADAFLERLREQQIQGTVLIVAHFRINQMLLGRLAGIPVERAAAIRQDNNWLYAYNPNTDISRAELSRPSNLPLKWEKGLLFSPYGCGPRPGPPKKGDML